MQNYQLCAFADEADRSIAGQIAALHDNGIRLLEMRGVNGKNVSALTREEAKAVKKELDAGEIAVWSLGSPAGKSPITQDFSVEREQFLRLLETADIMNARCIRLFSFYETGGERAYRDEVLYRLGEFVDMAKGSGVILCHENEKGIWGDVPERCLEIHRAIPQLRAVFDPANFVQCHADTLKAFEMLAPYIYYGHVKDARKDGVVVPPGKGMGHLADYLPRFLESGGSVLTLEPHLTKFTGRGNLEKGEDGATAAEWCFANGREAFDFAVNTLKELLRGGVAANG